MVRVKAIMTYLEVENYLYALVRSARKLRSYCHEHELTVLTHQPIKQFLQKSDASGRMIKWAMELSEFRIKFAPRTTIKEQALTDFIVESTQPQETPPKGIEKSRSLAHFIQMGRH